MADLTPLSDILNGADADATPVQNNFQAIEAYINGTDLLRTDGTKVMTADLDMDGNKIVSLADGTAAGDAVNKGQMDAADTAIQDQVDLIELGAWTSYTPTFTQSATISKTVNYAKYTRVGRTVICSASLTATSAGTGGADHNVVVGLPVAAATAEAISGFIAYSDDGGDGYSAVAGYGSGTSAIQFDYGSTGAFPSGGRVRLNISYEAAS